MPSSPVAGLPPWAGRYAQKWTRATLAHWGRTCHLCTLPGATTADHVIPRAKGGPDTLENLRPAHYSCNSVRQDLDLDEWFARHPVPRRPARTPSRQWS